jgi:hypothetical protein
VVLEESSAHTTTTGAKTWSQVNASYGADLLLLATAANGKSAVVTSIFGKRKKTENE